jgi:hypothetical protein
MSKSTRRTWLIPWALVSNKIYYYHIYELTWPSPECTRRAVELQIKKMKKAEKGPKEAGNATVLKIIKNNDKR